MIDIHHHLLPGIDDGSKSLEQSVAMVQMAMEDGITHIVATPHANDQYPYDRAHNEILLQQIREALPAETAAKMTLGLGCDFHLNWDNIEDARVNPHRYTINGTNYLLIELPDHGIPNSTDEVLYKLRVAGMMPILTHPERNATLQRTPGRLYEWIDSGLLVQVTTGSLTGHFGATAETMAWGLMKKKLVHFLATDAHNLERRPPHMSAAHDMVMERMGSATAKRLCVTNPLAVFQGKPLPQQPEADLGFETAEVKPSFWKRLFSRS
jgi:protein-tyrosine phosphatase